jgi:hypothetical protein
VPGWGFCREATTVARADHAQDDLQPLLDHLAAGDAAAADLLIERSVGRMRRLARFLLKARGTRPTTSSRTPPCGCAAP